MDTSLTVATIDVRRRIPMSIIREVVRRIVAEFRPQKVILFGSYAYGHPKPESDVDLLVIMEVAQETGKAIQIRQHINPLFGIDILVYSPDTIKKRLAWGDSFLHEIVQQGKVLYESVDT